MSRLCWRWGFWMGKKPFFCLLWNDKLYLVNSVLVLWMTSVNLLLVNWSSVGELAPCDKMVECCLGNYRKMMHWFGGPFSSCSMPPCPTALMSSKGLKIPAEECAVFPLTIVINWGLCQTHFRSMEIVCYWLLLEFWSTLQSWYLLVVSYLWMIQAWFYVPLSSHKVG